MVAKGWPTPKVLKAAPTPKVLQGAAAAAGAPVAKKCQAKVLQGGASVAKGLKDLENALENGLQGFPNQGPPLPERLQRLQGPRRRTIVLPNAGSKGPHGA